MITFFSIINKNQKLSNPPIEKNSFSCILPKNYKELMDTTLQPHHPYQSLPCNHMGTDYFVGDIHGQFSKLHDTLLRMGFSFETDRIISVGDLVDRGDQSEWADDWLQAPYFFAVRGNHEELYLRWWELRHDRNLQKTYEEETYFPNGGKWVDKTDISSHEKLALALSKLPYLITVPNKIGRLLGVVHAGLPDGCAWPQLINQKISTDTVFDMIWSRNRYLYARGDEKGKQVWDDGVIPGLDAVVCGHTVVDQPFWAGKFCHIETAGWRNGRKFTIMPLDQILNLARTKGL